MRFVLNPCIIFLSVAIAIGVAMLAIKESFKNPFTAIAAGVALTILSGALGGIANKAISGGGGGGGGGADSSSGGGVSGGGARSSSYGGGGGFQGGNVVFEIAGTKLVGVLSNTLNQNKSLGGNLSISG